MSDAHPSFDIRFAHGDELTNARIALCVTGSVACVRSPDLARAMMRLGADVIPVMTKAATELIHPHLMHWATGREPVTRLTGAIEHVALAGNVENPVDLVIVAPATANTIGKISTGIDDTPVTTTVTTALGEGIPVLVVPAMHEPMYRHPVVMENIEKLKRIGVDLVMPEVSEGKAKIAPVEEIVERVIHAIVMRTREITLADTRTLITVGRTVEYIDPIRCITNNSTGKMGMALAVAAKRLGSEVTVVYGKGTESAPAGIEVVRVDTAQEMKQAVENQLRETGYDICIAAAAVGDWMPAQREKSKITTHGAKKLTLDLVPTPKIIDDIKTYAPSVFLVAFRAQSDLSDEALIEDAWNRLKKSNADMIAANDTGRAGAGFESDTNELFLISSNREVTHIPLTEKSRAGATIISSIAREYHKSRTTEE